MKINTKIYVLAALLAAFSPVVKAQMSAPVNVVCNDLKQQGKDLYINAVITVRGDLVASKQSLTLTPVLESPTQKMGLPSILINGKNRNKVYNREIALNNLQDEPRFVVINGKDNPTATVSYVMTIPFEPWMKDAKFVLAQNLCGCGKEEPVEPLLIANKVRTRPDKRYEIVPTLVYISPEAETEKHRAEVGTAFLDFQVGKYQILPDFRNNATELGKIDNTINTVVNDKNITLKGIVLKGFASPEGTYKSNTVLAENRVKALGDYIRKKHDFQQSIFKLENGSEDWNGFREKVEADPEVPSRQKVLDIINSSVDPDKKDAQLAALDGGVPYRYVLKNIYPSLRRSDYKVDYLVREFTVDEGREIIKIRPQQLSLSEMFAVANSYPVGSEEYNNVFDIAVRMYNTDPVANLNAANIALAKNDLDAATKYLAKAGNTPEAVHARGVLEMLKGNLDTAKPLLEQAASMGVQDANLNLKELQKKQADNELFNSFE